MRELIERLEILEVHLRGSRDPVVARLCAEEVKTIIEELEREVREAEARR